MGREQRIEPATLAFDGGVAFSPRYGDVYASRDGALEQARHVFLGGNELPQRWARREQFVVFETGFGLGVNFLAAWQAWHDDPLRPKRLHFVSVERHPVSGDDLLLAAPPPLRCLAAQLAEQWPLPLPGLHRAAFDDGRITLTLAFGDAASIVQQLVLGADAFFLDGFAPDRNPDMWAPPLLKALARMARPGATLATWCTAATVRAALVACGFTVERRPGFGRKREMLAARFEPRWTVRRHEPPLPRAEPRRALVVGAGLAGCATALALARRDWQVELLDAGDGPALGASALPWGLLHPQVSSDDNVLSRLTRAGFLLGVRELSRIAGNTGLPLWSACGVLQQRRADAGAEGLPRALRSLGAPLSFAQWLDADDAQARAGLAPANAGIWFPTAGIVSARRWCRAMIDASPRNIVLRTGAFAARVGGDESGWCVLDRHGRSLGRAEVLIVAAALDSPQLLGLDLAPVRPVRGRMTLLDDDNLAPLRAVLAGDGYAARTPDGFAVAGSSYEFEPEPGAHWASDDTIHRGNLQRLARLLALPVPARPAGMFDGMRCVAHDRLPLAGPVADERAAIARAGSLRGAHLADLPRQRGLFASFAFGSRGLALAPLAGELIAAQVEGEPWPVERDLAAAIDPARFLLRWLRGGGSGAA
jgi:tRNA 5-methylaminomethyl-2-thiouridine biosynthesis bifunctional protein